MTAKKPRYLDFELPLKELDEQIEHLKNLKFQGSMNLDQEVRTLEEKAKTLLTEIHSGLSPYQIVQLARHPDRPTSLDYVNLICDEFLELHGDRNYAEDGAIVGGLARMGDLSFVLIAQQKGRDTQENMVRNFGMPRPEGYRKALRLMRLAERWNKPIVTFIDTPGAYPGIDAEERGQAEAIAKNIMTMTGLKVPILSIILGEGGSGGALAVAVADKLLMMKHSVFSVISPEGCAAIVWKDGAYTSEAAKQLKITANDIVSFGIADSQIEEPVGGAHRDRRLASQLLKEAIQSNLKNLLNVSPPDLLKARYERYRKMGSVAA